MSDGMYEAFAPRNQTRSNLKKVTINKSVDVYFTENKSRIVIHNKRQDSYLGIKRDTLKKIYKECFTK